MNTKKPETKFRWLIHFGIAIVLFNHSAFCEEKYETFPANLGLGEHLQNPEWNGKELILSKLHKGEDLITLVRVSLSDYVVRSEKSSEVFFKMTNKIDFFSPGLPNSFLVDFRRNSEYVTALMYGDRGYYCVKASIRPMVVDPPNHWLPIKMLETKKWYLTEAIKITDPYPDSIGAESGIIATRLNDTGQIEFQLTQDDQKPNIVDVISFGTERKKTEQGKWIQLLKNGEKWQDSPVWNRGYLPFVIDEQEEKEMYQNQKSTEGVRDRCGWNFESKDEAIKWYRDNFQDKQAAEAIIQIIDKAFAAEK